jgi:hypothetical protein
VQKSESNYGWTIVECVQKAREGPALRGGACFIYTWDTCWRRERLIQAVSCHWLVAWPCMLATEDLTWRAGSFLFIVPSRFRSFRSRDNFGLGPENPGCSYSANTARVLEQRDV